MNTRMTRAAGWAAILSGIAAILALVTVVLFFAIEMDSGQDHVWGPLSDIFPIVQMALLLVIARAMYVDQRPAAPRVSLFAAVIGAAGMLGVIVLQVLLRLGVIPFMQEVGPLTLAFGLIGIWLILTSHVGRRHGSLPSRLGLLGIVVGAAFVMEPVIVFGAGTADWRSFMSNPLLIGASAIVFALVYFGYPIWAIWLGRMWLRAEPSAAGEQRMGLASPPTGNVP